MVGARRIKSEKLREDRYREGYARSLEGKSVKGDGYNNVKHMWEQVKWAKVEGAREVCGSVRVGGKNSKSVWWNDEIKLQLGERRLLGRGFWQLVMKTQKKDVWKHTERRRGK